MASLIVEDISSYGSRCNEHFAYGMYDEFNVIIKKDNGYVNVSKLCALANKQFKHWNSKDQRRELIDRVEMVLKESSGILDDPFKAVEFVNIEEPDEIRGTYAHPLYVPHIASWASSKFAVKVSRIVNDFLVDEAKRIICSL